MITLSEAFRLCHIHDEAVFLRSAEEPREDTWFWSKWVTDSFDMKKVFVVGIEPRFQRYGPDFLGMLFVVRGVSAETLREIANKAGAR